MKHGSSAYLALKIQRDCGGCAVSEEWQTSAGVKDVSEVSSSFLGDE
jgi:hypothetical protein